MRTLIHRRPDPEAFQRLGQGYLPMRHRPLFRLLFFLPVGCFVWLMSCSGYDYRTAEAQMRFGVQMAQRGLWNEALFRFRQARRMNPNNPRILNNLAVAYEAVGLFEEALQAYQEALRLDPGNRDLRRNYGRFVEFYQNFRPAEEQPEADEPPERVPEEDVNPLVAGPSGGPTGPVR